MTKFNTDDRVITELGAAGVVAGVLTHENREPSYLIVFDDDVEAGPKEWTESAIRLEG